ncbi:uncharacterized protein PFL1_03380 [Pseudozyma flocculosa PF-1]|uniref:Heme oxygenase n=2 Tax=Pseudozyma flocculosa TaxID=84751 RepID=A0A5C3F8U9_9BASI|nr:uncharacterized protein PFL1_03380 [Pseudozyma flocculosa PF-1]EPQ29091.1 hypothetical protein PFL1_03380 [Pseudozyma flocculosa PF-1]SPO40085.1 uncharacterized protein PSFLO_05567 [Pseudozyma flocculosa]
MGCPFAHLASLASAGKTSYHDRPADPQPRTSQVTLSQALRDGTAASHRQVERSKGVSLLLNSVTTGRSANSDDHQDQDALLFDRKDYLRWLVMLASIYITLEAGLRRTQTAEAQMVAPLLQPLLNSPLPALLGRTRSLLLDIAAHLAVLESHHGAQLEDLVQETRDTFDIDTAEGIDKEAPASRADLTDLVISLQPDALDFAVSATATATPPPPTSCPPTIQLSPAHIDLLTPAQVHATRGYARHLASFFSDTHRNGHDAGPLIVHAYTRYLGDLSGGQHILKKVAKRWPCEVEEQPSSESTALGDGFDFYRFKEAAAVPLTTTATGAAHASEPGLDGPGPSAADLKVLFRDCMDEGLDRHVGLGASRCGALTALVKEGNTSFEQNAALFEALLPAKHRMSAQDDDVLVEGTLPSHSPIALPQQSASPGPSLGSTALSLVQAVLLPTSAQKGRSAMSAAIPSTFSRSLVALLIVLVAALLWSTQRPVNFAARAMLREHSIAHNGTSLH